MSLKEIELEYQNDLNNFKSLTEFFDENENIVTKVPQFSPNSQYIQYYSDEKYQKIIDELERHYSYLCSEEVLSN